MGVGVIVGVGVALGVLVGVAVGVGVALGVLVGGKGVKVGVLTITTSPSFEPDVDVAVGIGVAVLRGKGVGLGRGVGVSLTAVVDTETAVADCVTRACSVASACRVRSAAFLVGDCFVLLKKNRAAAITPQSNRIARIPITPHIVFDDCFGGGIGGGGGGAGVGGEAGGGELFGATGGGRVRFVPQETQNFEPEGVGVPQCGQGTVVVESEGDTGGVGDGGALIFGGGAMVSSGFLFRLSLADRPIAARRASANSAPD